MRNVFAVQMSSPNTVTPLWIKKLCIIKCVGLAAPRLNHMRRAIRTTAVFINDTNRRRAELRSVRNGVAQTLGARDVKPRWRDWAPWLLAGVSKLKLTAAMLISGA
jgi:hypothetical protein